ncbi:MAG: ribbon-helix-helix domain-containing protein [Thermoleophilia bacterium]|nr:ribbon-helix-helix domain-containing protein [Thermoleophilia bacterium]
MKTAISIPDDVFEDAERLARTLKKSRSRLYVDAVREYVARHSGDQVTQALDQMLGAVRASDSEFAASAARPILKRSDW